MILEVLGVWLLRKWKTGERKEVGKMVWVAGLGLVDCSL